MYIDENLRPDSIKCGVKQKSNLGSRVKVDLIGKWQVNSCAWEVDSSEAINCQNWMCYMVLHKKNLSLEVLCAAKSFFRFKGQRWAGKQNFDPSNGARKADYYKNVNLIPDSAIYFATEMLFY